MKTQPNFSSYAVLFCGLFFILPVLSAQQPKLPLGKEVDWKQAWAYPNHNNPTSMLRSDQVAYKLDSASGTFGRMLFEYDAEGRLIKETDYSVLDWELPALQKTLTYLKTPALNKITSTQARYNPELNTWIDIERTEEGYAPLERRWFYQQMVWDSTVKDWVPEYISEETFYPNGVRKTFVSQYWNAYTQTLVTDMRAETEIDDAGRITKEVVFSWNYVTSRLELDYTEEYTYTAAGTLAYTLYYSNWNFETNTWMMKDSSAYTYEPALRETMMTKYSWDSALSAWNYQYRVITRTDALENETYHLSVSYNTASQQWVNSMLSKYEYTPTGALVKLETYTWDDNRSTWSGIYCEEFVLDEQDITLIEYSYAWNAATNTWGKNEETAYLFDSLGNAVGSVLMQWNDSTNVYEKVLKTQLFLKYQPEPVTQVVPTKPAVETLLPALATAAFLQDAITLEFWNAETGTWVLFGRNNYYWSPLTPTSTTEQVIVPVFRVYPNPVYDYLTVEMNEPSNMLATGILTDLSGRLVKQFALPTTGQVDMQALPAGAYILHVRANGKFAGALRVVKGEN